MSRGSSAPVKTDLKGWNKAHYFMYFMGDRSENISQFDQMYDFSGFSQRANAVVQHQRSEEKPFLNHLRLYSTLTFYRTC